MNTIYLASNSPRRSELLNQIEIHHIVMDVPAAPGEDEPRHPGESPLEYVKRTALEKSLRANQWIESTNGIWKPENPVLTADTTVALGDLILGKPVNDEDAARILKMLSGQTHIVYTAVVLSCAGQRWEKLSTSEVTFRRLNEREIADYIMIREPFGKAGAYGIQGIAAKYIKELKGSYSGVMGLPLFETAELFREAKLD